MGVQTQINIKPALAVNGDRASLNPFSSAISPPAGFVAGAGGVTVARFAWVDTTDPTKRKLLNTDGGTGNQPVGFIARTMQALVTVFLDESSMLIPVGYEVTASLKGDYFMEVAVVPAVKGNKVFANIADGTMQSAAAGTIIAGYTETQYVVSLGASVGELAIITL